MTGRYFWHEEEQQGELVRLLVSAVMVVGHDGVEEQEDCADWCCHTHDCQHLPKKGMKAISRAVSITDLLMCSSSSMW